MPLEKKSFEAPDEVRSMADKGSVEIVRLGGGVVGRLTCLPGWRWSEHVKPVAGTPSCQANHVGFMMSGGMKIVMDDGAEIEAVAGDVVAISPGHDAWVISDEPCVFIDFGGMELYAK